MIVINAAMQKSGSVWLQSMVGDLMVASGFGHIADIREKYRLSWFIRPSGHAPRLRFYKLAHLLAPHFFGNSFAVTTHAPPTQLVKWLISNGTIRPIYIYRDPRDVARSLFEHGEHLRREKIRSSTQFDTLLTMADAIHMARTFLPIWEIWTSVPGTLLMTYENLRRDPLGEMRKIADFLELEDTSDEVLHEIVDRYDASKQKVESFSWLHFNRAVVGRWKEVMDEEAIELCNTFFGGYLERMGYDPS
jgi:hypothetical protein